MEGFARRNLFRRPWIGAAPEKRYVGSRMGLSMRPASISDA